MKLSLVSLFENAAEKAKLGSMVAFMVPTNIAVKFSKMFNKISGDDVKPRDQHITIGLVRNFSGKEDKIKSLLNKIMRSHKPFSCTVESFGTFEPSESNEYKYVLYAKPSANEIYEIHERVLKILKKNGIKIDNGNFDFSPHITIKYCDEKPVLDDINRRFNFVIEDVTFAINNKHHVVKLG